MRRALTTAVVLSGVSLTGCGDWFFIVSREAILVARVVTADDQTGIPCKVTHTLSGEEERQAVTEVVSGQEFNRTVAVGTPLRMSHTFRLRVALVVRCVGYEQASSPEREVEVGWLTKPKTDLGTITVGQTPAGEPAVRRGER
jgi:hypothetical protein